MASILFIRYYINLDSKPKTMYYPKTHSTVWPHRLMVRTSGFHPGNRGSIPLGAKRKALPFWEGFSFG